MHFILYTFPGIAIFYSNFDFFYRTTKKKTAHTYLFSKCLLTTIFAVFIKNRAKKEEKK